MVDNSSVEVEPYEEVIYNLSFNSRNTGEYSQQENVSLNRPPFKGPTPVSSSDLLTSTARSTLGIQAQVWSAIKPTHDWWL